MQAHPAAEFFPSMSPAELAALTASIREKGQTFPIITCQDLILDGRHRWRACEILGRKPWTVEWNGEGGTPEDYVIQANLDRRHLTESQRAMVGARLKAYFEKAASERRRSTQNNDAAEQFGPIGPDSEPGRSRDKAAEKVKASPRSVERAAVVIDHGVDELQDAVDSGEVAVSAAAAVARLPENEQREVVKAGPAAVRQRAKKERGKRSDSLESSILRTLKRCWSQASDEERSAFKHWLADRGDIKRAA